MPIEDELQQLLDTLDNESINPRTHAFVVNPSDFDTLRRGMVHESRLREPPGWVTLQGVQILTSTEIPPGHITLFRRQPDFQGTSRLAGVGGLPGGAGASGRTGGAGVLILEGHGARRTVWDLLDQTGEE